MSEALLRFGTNLMLVGGATLAAKLFVSDDIVKYVRYSAVGYILIDLGVSMMNNYLSISRKDLIASSHGVIGTIRELCKRRKLL